MDKEIVMQLIDLVKAGGISAVWVLMVYQIVGLLKALIIPAAWVLCVKYVFTGFFELLKWGYNAERNTK